MAKPVFLTVTPELMAREGLTETIAPWEDGLRIDTAPGSFEWWYFDAHFDDGTTAVITFATKPLLERNKRLKPSVILTITRPDGTKISQFPIFPAEQFSASKETCDVRIGSNWTTGDLHTYRVHVEMDGLAADLTFTGLVPPWRPGVGKSFFGDMEHYFAWLPSIPYGIVAGTLTYDGHTQNVTGTGYHDHNWGNVGLNDVMDHWYWGRAHIGEFTLIYVEMITAREYGYQRIPVFMLAKDDRILTGDGLPLTMITSDFVGHPDGRSYPREVDFHWQADDATIDIRLRRPELIEGVSLLTTFPAWQRRLIQLFANPYYFRFNANLELSIHFGDTQTTESGPALFEIMILQGRNHP